MNLSATTAVAPSTQWEVTLVEQVRMARDTYRMRLRAPELAARILPGQFFMLRLDSGSDPLLGRPFALYDVWCENGAPAGVDFGYVAIGKMTRAMVNWPAGESVRIWGPLGNGFPVPPAGRLLMVAGGIGQTPFLAVGREALGAGRYGQPARQIETTSDSLRLLYGARNQEFLAGLDDFADAGIDVKIATDDGSAGYHGLVTGLLEEELRENPPASVYCCGPEPMMRAVASRCETARIPCWLSLESPMACGFGVCFSCVVKVKTPGGWDYRRSCVEGPVFRAAELELSEAATACLS